MYEFDRSFVPTSDVMQLPPEVPEVVIEESYNEQPTVDDHAELDTSVVGVSEFRTDSEVTTSQEVDEPVVAIPQETPVESRENEQEQDTPAPVVKAAGTIAVSGESNTESANDAVIEELAPQADAKEEKADLPQEDAGELENEPELESIRESVPEQEEEGPKPSSEGGDVVDPPEDGKVEKFEAFPDPDAQLALASSIAQCDAREGAWAYDTLRTYLPLPPYNQSSQLAQRAQTAATASMLERVANPDTAVGYVSLFTKLFDDKTLAVALAESGQEPTAENINASRSELLRIAERLEDPAADAAKVDLFKAKLDTAQIVATLHSVEVAEVFADEGLYNVLMRELYTPDRLAAEGIARTQRVLATNPGAVNEELARQAYDQLTIRELERYWGADVFEHLDPALKAQLNIS